MNYPKEVWLILDEDGHFRFNSAFTTKAHALRWIKVHDDLAADMRGEPSYKSYLHAVRIDLIDEAPKCSSVTFVYTRELTPDDTAVLRRQLKPIRIDHTIPVEEE